MNPRDPLTKILTISFLQLLFGVLRISETLEVGVEFWFVVSGCVAGNGVDCRVSAPPVSSSLHAKMS